jgi:phosphoglycolate phosphatase
MTLDAVCFDLDGTIVDSRAGIEAALRAAVREVLPGRELGQLDGLVGPPLEVMLERLLPDLDAPRQAVASAFRRHYDSEGWQSAVPYPGIPEALDALAAGGLRLDLVTNKRSAPTRLILGTPALAGRFALAVSLDTVAPSHRTKADALAALVRATGLSPSSVAYVGDSEEDRIAAIAATCPFVAVGWGYGGVAETAQPTDLGVVANPWELPLLLLSPKNRS